MINRILSGLVAIGYLVTVYMAGGPKNTVMCAVVLILPLACIWSLDREYGRIDHLTECDYEVGQCRKPFLKRCSLCVS